MNEVGAEPYFKAGLRERMQFEVAPLGPGARVGDLPAFFGPPITGEQRQAGQGTVGPKLC